MAGRISQIFRVLAVLLLVAAGVVAIPAGAASAQSSGQPGSVVVVLDLSGSMFGPRLDQAKGAISSVVGGLDEGEVNLGLRTFPDCGVSNSVVAVGPLNKAAYLAAVDGLSAFGSTDISTSLSAAAGDVPVGGRIVLISDGGHNCGDPQPCAVAQGIAAQGREIQVDTVSFNIAGGSAAEQALRCIAGATGGRTFAVEDEDALRESLQQSITDPPPPPPPRDSDFVEQSNANIGVPSVVTVSDPVQVSSGNFTDAAVDLSFGQSVFGMDLVRSYNSAAVLPGASSDPQRSVLGDGWRLGHHMTAHTEADGRVAITLGSGRIVRFQPDGSGGFVRPSAFYGDLITDGGRFRIEFFNGERWDFTDNRVTAMTSPDRGAVHLDYDAAGRLTVIRSTTGAEYRLRYNTQGLVSDVDAVVDGEVDRSISYEYDAAGHLAAVVDAIGNRTTYGSDADGRVTSVTDATGVVRVEMTYDSEGRVATQLMPTGERNEFSYGDDGVTTLTATAAVDSDGTTRSDVYRYESDERGYTVGLTDPLGAEVDLELDGDGQPTGAADRRANEDDDPAGAQLDYQYDEFGNITAQVLPGVGTYSFTYTYSATGDDGEAVTLHRLASVTAPNGGVTSYTYEGLNTVPSTITGPEGLAIDNTIEDGLVTSTSDADGVTTTFGYDRYRRLTDITDGVGNRSRLLYDDAGRITRIIDPGGAATVMTYDDEGRLLSVTDRTGAVFGQEFDAADRLVAYTDALDAAAGIDSRAELTYDSAGLLSAFSDQRSNTTSYGYDGFGQMTALTLPGAATWQFEFAELGRMQAVTEPSQDEPTFRFGHDVEGLVASVEQADGAGTEIVRDDANRPITITDGNGVVSTFTYDSDGGGVLLTEGYAVGTADEVAVDYGYDDQYRVVSVSGPRSGQVTRYQYTPAGRLASVTDANGNTTTFGYDAAGRVETVTQPGDRVVRYHYDSNSRVVAVTSPEGLRYQTGYDLEGRITELISPSGIVNRFTYNGNGTVTSATVGGGCQVGGEPVVCPRVDFGSPRLMATPDGLKASKVVPITGIDGEYDITLRSFDSRHARLPRQDQPQEQWVLEALDDKGHVLFTTAPSDDIPDDRAGNETMVGRHDMTGVAAVRARHAFDLGERQWNSVTPAGVTFTGPGGQTRSFDVDALVVNGATDSNGGSTEFSYDGRYNMTRWVDQNGQASTYEYSQSDEVTTRTDPLGRRRTTTFDGQGRPSTIDDGSDRTYTIGYDPEGRVVSTTYADGSSQEITYDNLDRVVARTDRAPDGSEVGRIGYGYEPGGSLTSVTETDGDVVGYSYDAVGNRTSLTYPDGATVDYGYDELNRMVSATHSEHGVTTYHYDDDSRLVRVVFPGGEERSYGYTNDQLTSFADGDKQWHLSYDGRGRIDEITGADHWAFSYGQDGQLDTASRNKQRWSYSYDPVGNLTSISEVSDPDGDTSSTFNHDPANQIKTANSSKDWTHDGAGRLTDSDLDGVATSYRYDVRGRLDTVTEAKADGTHTWTRTYGPDNLLATVTRTGPDKSTTTWELTWDRTAFPPQPLGWSGPSDIELVHGVGPTLAVADGVASPVELGPLGDIVGSPVAVSDHYGPFGTTGSSSADQPGFGLGYRGELHTGPTINLKYRDLNPQLGRFLTVDPVRPSAGSSATSRYAYAANDPINLVDPLGLAPGDGKFCEGGVLRPLPPTTQPSTTTTVPQGPSGTIPPSTTTTTQPQSPTTTTTTTIPSIPHQYECASFGNGNMGWHAAAWLMFGLAYIGAGSLPFVGEVIDGAECGYYSGQAAASEFEEAKLDASTSCAAAAIPFLSAGLARFFRGILRSSPSPGAVDNAVDALEEAGSTTRRDPGSSPPTTLAGGGPDVPNGRALDDVERLFDDLDDDVVFHYTTGTAAESIVESGRIIPGDSGYVYVTQDMLTTDEAFTHLFAGNPGFTGRGDAVVAFRVDPGLRLSPGTQVNELIHQGAIRLTEENLVYVGPNPWN